MAKRKMANKKLTSVINKCAEKHPDIDPKIVRLIWLEGYSFQNQTNNIRTKNVPYNAPSKAIVLSMRQLYGMYPYSKNIEINLNYGDAYFSAGLQRQIQDSGCNWDQVVKIAKHQSKVEYEKEQCVDCK